ncbi:MAG TPA: Fic family protein [Kaistella chaponensis]|uniref:Fic family protein n=1 Tax=Kaistella chaponensis TaxID=713588 RepID=UPI002BF82F53|nr:Fic family protein [Kaistella chaponensis]HPW89538.1 Fic family protein [Kaistella chaponensis]HQC06041.1 Fic family protein [Kaistella chaponensis]
MKWQVYPYYFEGLEKQLERIHEKKRELDKKRPIPSYVLKSIKDSLSIEWTYNSNSIEGNTLTLQETKMVIKDGFTIKGKSLREHFEVVNHQEAIEFVESLASNEYVLNKLDILSIHHLVLQKIEKDFAGKYRTSGVRISGANFVPPNALKVDEFVSELIDFANDSEVDILIRSAIFHHRFAWIHPFFDGNGRTARLLLNLILMKSGFPPAIILKNDRKKYYDALNQANNQDYSKLVLLILQAVERTLDIYLGNLNNTYDQYQSITDIVSEPDVPYGQEYVSLLARKGKIDAFKEGRNWLTTKDAVLDYIENRDRKRVLKKEAED